MATTEEPEPEQSDDSHSNGQGDRQRPADSGTALAQGRPYDSAREGNRITWRGVLIAFVGAVLTATITAGVTAWATYKQIDHDHKEAAAAFLREQRIKAYDSFLDQETAFSNDALPLFA